MKKALLIVDVQNDYFKDGKLPLAGMEEASQNIAKLISRFRAKSLPVIHIQHFSTREGATFFIPDTTGVEIHDSVKPLENEPVLKKNYPNSFRETGLDELLKKEEIEELIICGAMTHMCIDTTTRAAFDLKYKNSLIADACATLDLEFRGTTVKASDVHAAYLAALGAVFAEIKTTEEFLTEN